MSEPPSVKELAAAAIIDWKDSHCNMERDKQSRCLAELNDAGQVWFIFIRTLIQAYTQSHSGVGDLVLCSFIL